jgi:uncharacterized BrkB/YihY/UPF0761 family membrane protein
MVVKLIIKNHRKSVRIAIDFTTLLLIISVHYFIMVIWKFSLLWVILLLMIIVAIIFVMVHWKIKQEINFSKLFKGFWRFNFLLFSLIYIILLLYGLLLNVSMAVTMA